MENASKALLIAAAVLIVIILISFGMIILNSTQDTAEHAQGVGSSISDASKTALGKVQASFNKDGTIDISSILTPEQIEGKADITSEQLSKIILGDERKSLGSYNGNWRIIGKDGEKHKLVSTSKVANVTLGGNTLEKAIDSYVKSEDILNKAAKDALKNISSNGKVQVRSIKVEDIYALLEKYPEQRENVYEYYKGDDNKIYNHLNDIASNFNVTVYDAIVDNETLYNRIKNGERIKLEANYLYYEVDPSYFNVNAYDYLSGPSYWLASPALKCGPIGAGFYVVTVYGRKFV